MTTTLARDVELTDEILALIADRAVAADESGHLDQAEGLATRRQVLTQVADRVQVGLLANGQFNQVRGGRAEGGTGVEGAGARRGSLALRCPALTATTRRSTTTAC